MKVVILFTTMLLSLFFSRSIDKTAIYVMNYGQHINITTIISKCNVMDDTSDTVRIQNIDSNLNLNSKVGEYYIVFDAIDEVGNISTLKIIVIIIPKQEYRYKLYKNNPMTINEILDDIGLVDKHYSIIYDSFSKNESNSGESEIKLEIDLVKNYIVTISILRIDSVLNDKDCIIYPLYNRITEDRLKELISINLDINNSDIFSIKHNIDIYHDGHYNLEVMLNNNEIVKIDFIVKEMLPDREVTLYEKLYIYLTIFFNIDSRYKTTNFFEFDTRIKYISNIYKSGRIRV